MTAWMCDVINKLARMQICNTRTVHQPIQTRPHAHARQAVLGLRRQRQYLCDRKRERSLRPMIDSHTHTHTDTHTHALTYTHMHSRTQTHTYTHAHTDTHTHMHSRTHALTHSHSYQPCLHSHSRPRVRH